jgi:serine/threonine protein kinase
VHEIFKRKKPILSEERKILDILNIHDKDEKFTMYTHEDNYINYGGHTLKYCINNNLFNDEQILTILTRVAENIHFLHTCGIYHMDIHCDNIVINEKLNVRIIDFDLSTLSSSTRRLKNYYSKYDASDQWPLFFNWFRIHNAKSLFEGQRSIEVLEISEIYRVNDIDMMNYIRHNYYCNNENFNRDVYFDNIVTPNIHKIDIFGFGKLINIKLLNNIKCQKIYDKLYNLRSKCLDFCPYSQYNISEVLSFLK